MNQYTILKRGARILLIIILVILNVLFVKAITYNIDYKCDKNLCIEGEIAEWNITIFNYGQKKMEFTSLEVVDSVNRSVIAYYNITYNPFTSVNPGLITISPEGKETKPVKGRLPKANSNNNLIYNFCYSNTAMDNNILVREGIYTIRNCDNKNYSLIILECNVDSNCAYNATCKNKKCVELKCSECQYASSHQCMDYECCESNKCEEYKVCEDHKCVNLNCGYDEQLFNHTCQRLNCSYDEQLFNHTCQRLNCSYDEQFFNHTCEKLNCMFNETFENHTCKKLNCAFFQKKVNHNCVNDKPLIVRLVIELIILSVIIFLLFVDVKKFELRKKLGLKK